MTFPCGLAFHERTPQQLAGGRGFENARFAVQRGPCDGQVRNTLHHALRQVDSNGVTWQPSEPQSQLNFVIDVSILRVCRMAT